MKMQNKSRKCIFGALGRWVKLKTQIADKIRIDIPSM